jgi:hypothetical protein
VLTEAIEPLRKGGAIDPILVHDLDGDGFPEVLLPAVNRVYSRRHRVDMFRVRW